MNIPDKEQDRIEATAKKADLTVEEVVSKVEEEMEELKDHKASEISDDALYHHAVTIVKNSLLKMTGGSGFGGGETEELPILTMGYQRKEGDYFVTDNDALLASGIINPPDEPAGYSVFIIDSDHGVDLDHAADAFSPLNTVRGHVAKRRVGSRDGEPSIKKGGAPTYLVNSTDESKFTVEDPGELPSDDPLSELPGDRESKRNLIHENFIGDEEQFTIQNYVGHESILNDNGYPVAFGVDVKRIRGEVVDSVVFDSGNGFMTITDDTVFGEEDIPEDLIGDQMRTPGLQVAVTGDLVYGENSVLDIYGYIQQRDDGQYRMDALGIIPIVEFDYDDDPVSTGSSNNDDPASEDTL